MELLLVINTALTTLSAISVFAIFLFAKSAKRYSAIAKETADNLKMVHNTHVDTIENMIAKMNDIQTQIALVTRNSRR